MLILACSASRIYSKGLTASVTIYVSLIYVFWYLFGEICLLFCHFCNTLLVYEFFYAISAFSSGLTCVLYDPKRYYIHSVYGCSFASEIFSFLDSELQDMVHHKFCFTVNDIVDIVETGEFDWPDVFVFPPDEYGGDSAEDSGDEDEGDQYKYLFTI